MRRLVPALVTLSIAVIFTAVGQGQRLAPTREAAAVLAAARNKQVILLPIEGVKEALVVEQNRSRLLPILAGHLLEPP